MLIYEYKLDGNQQQYQAIDEAIRSDRPCGGRVCRKVCFACIDKKEYNG